MTDIKELLESIGSELSEEAKSQFLAEHAKSYKPAAEMERKLNKANGERDALREQLDAMKADLQKFDGVDLESLRKQIEDANERANAAEKEYQEKIAERDEMDAIIRGLGKYKFSSNAAKESVVSKAKEAKLPITESGVVGLDELMSRLKEEDPGAFADEEAPKAQFTKTLENQAGQKITDLDSKTFAKMGYRERVELKRANPELYERLKN